MKSAVRAEVAALQAEYEKMAAHRGVTFKVEGLVGLKTSGVSLPRASSVPRCVPAQRAWLQSALKAMDEKSEKDRAFAMGESRTSLARRHLGRYRVEEQAEG